MPIFPKDLFPLTDVQPFTKNDSYTFLDRLNSMTDLVNQVEGDFRTLVKKTAEIVNVLNGRIGSPEPLFIDLSNGNVDVEIPNIYPAGHSFWLIVKQGAAGGNTITLPSNITGEFHLSSAPHDYTPLLIHPVKKLATDYFIDQTINRLVKIIQGLDDKIVAEVKKANEAVDAAKKQFEARAEALSTDIKTAKETMSKELADAKTAMEKALSEKAETLTKLVNDTKTDLIGKLTTLERELREFVNTKTTELSTTLRGEMSNLKTWVETHVKAIVVNVKDHGAKGNGVADDHAAIMAAVEFAGDGGTVYFPAGKYRITDTLATRQGQRWVGAALNSDARPDRSGTYIFSDHGGNAITIGKDKSASIESMRIQGPGFARKESVGVHCTSSSCTLRDVSIWNFQRGMYLKEVWYGVVDRCHFMENEVGVHIEYCYNLTFMVPRIYSNRGDGIRGIGMRLTDRSMVSIHGGSIEDYQQAFWVQGGSSLYFAGMYFESAFDDKNKVPFVIVYVHDTSLNTNITAIGNQVYMTHHEAFIDFSKPGAGELITAFGNKIKCTAPNPTGIVYKISGSNNLSCKLLGDSYAEAAGQQMNYVSNVSGFTPGSVVTPGPGVPDNANGIGGGTITNIAGGIKITNSIDGAIPALGLGVLNAPLTAQQMPGGWYDQKQGTICYFSSINKPGFWDGRNWKDFSGGTLA